MRLHLPRLFLIGVHRFARASIFRQMSFFKNVFRAMLECTGNQVCFVISASVTEQCNTSQVSLRDSFNGLFETRDCYREYRYIFTYLSLFLEFCSHAIYNKINNKIYEHGSIIYFLYSIKFFLYYYMILLYYKIL